MTLGAICFALANPSVSPAQDASKRKPAITALAVCDDGKGFVYGSQTGLFFRALQGSATRRIATELEHIHDLAFSADGKILAVAGGSPAEFGSVELISWPEGKSLGHLEDHADVVYDVAWIGPGRTLAAASADRTISIWNGKTRKRLRTLAGHSGPVLALAVSPDGKLLCSGSADQTIRVWDLKSGKLLRAMTNHLGAVQALAFRPPQPDAPHFYLASTSQDGTLRIWHPAIGRLVRIVRHGAPIYCVAWSKNGKHVFTGAKNGSVRKIDGDSDEFVKTHSVKSGRPVSLVLGPHQIIVGTSAGAIAKFDR